MALEKKAKEMIRAGRIINRLVVNEATLPAQLSADWNGKEFELRGTISTEALRKRIEHAFFDLNLGPVKNQIKVDPKVINPAWLPKLSLFPLEFFTQNPGQPATVAIEGNNIRLKSAFIDETWKSHVLASTKSIGLSVVDEIAIIPKKSCRLVAMLAGKGLQLEGLVPNQELAQSLEKAAAQTGAKVTSQITVEAHSIPPQWSDQAAGFLAGFLAETPYAELELNGDKIHLSRQVNHFEEKAKWLEKANKVMPGAKIVDQMKFPTSRQPFQFGVTRAAGELVLKGWVPNLDLKTKILSAARAKFPGAPLKDELFAAPNVSMPDWGAALPDFLAALPGNGDIPPVLFQEEGVSLPKDKRDEWARLTLNSIGKKFPSFQVPEFGFLLTRNNTDINLSGWLPSEGLKKGAVDKLKTKFPTFKIKDEVKVDPSLTLPAWGALLPDFLGSLPSLDGISNLGFDAKGLKLPGTVSVDFKKLARTIFGDKFPGLDAPAPASDPPTVAATPPVPVPAPAPAKIPSAPIPAPAAVAMAPPTPTPAPVAAPAPVVKTPPAPAPVVKTPPAPAPVAKTPPAPAPKVEPVMTTKVEKLPPPAPVATPKPAPAPTPAPVMAKKEAPVVLPPPAPVVKPTPVVLPRPRPVTSLASTAVYGANSYPADLFVDYDGKKVRITGNVPSDKTKKNVGDAVAAALSKVEISNQIHVDKRVIPPVWEDLIPAFITDFFKIRASEAELEIDQDRLRLKQQLLDDRTKVEFVARGLDLLPRGRFIDQLSTPNYDPFRVYQAPPPVRETGSKYVVYFDSASYALDKSSLREIQAAVDYYKKSRSNSASIFGFTDGRGNPVYNKILSEKRAGAVVNHMVSKGVKRSAIRYEGLGANQSWVGDVREHRRVEIVIE